DTADDIARLLVGQIGMNRQGERLLRRALAFEKRAGQVAQIFETWLQVQRHRIVDFSPDSVLPQVRLQTVAIAGADDVLIEDVPVCRDLRETGGNPRRR